MLLTYWTWILEYMISPLWPNAETVPWTWQWRWNLKVPTQGSTMVEKTVTATLRQTCVFTGLLLFWNGLRTQECTGLNRTCPACINAAIKNLLLLGKDRNKRNNLGKTKKIILKKSKEGKKVKNTINIPSCLQENQPHRLRQTSSERLYLQCARSQN